MEPVASRELGVVTRRRFLGLAAGGLGIALIGVACDDEDGGAPAATATSVAASPLATERATQTGTATEAPA